MGSPLFSKADPLDQISAYQIFQPDSLCPFGIVSSADESSEGEEARVTTKEEYEVDWAHSWMEVGGAGIGGGGGTGVVESGISLCLVLLSLSDFTVLWLSLAFVTDPFSLFQGLHLLRQASLLREEAQQLEVEGLQKVELAVAGSEAEGLYGLLRGALSHSSMSSTPPHI